MKVGAKLSSAFCKYTYSTAHHFDLVKRTGVEDMSFDSALASALIKCFDQHGDFVIVVLDDTGNEDSSEEGPPRKRKKVAAEFRVWSQLLGAWSDVFAAMFTHDFKEKAEMKLEIKGFTVHAVASFLRFFYSGNLQADAGTLIEISSLADKYAIPPLQDICAKRIDTDLTPESACEVFQVADNLGSATAKERALKCICKSPQVSLTKGFMLSPPLLDEVLKSEALCIDDFTLGKLILEWSNSPAAKVRDIDVGALFKRHVQIAALTEAQYSKLKSLAEHVSHGALVTDMWSQCKRGTSTTNLFATIWKMYTAQFPDTNNRPPFLGFWLNVIPSQASFAKATTKHYNHMNLMERIARTDDTMSLGTNDEMEWMTPHHGIYISGASFAKVLPTDSHIQVFASSDHRTWHMLVDSQVHDALHTDEGSVVPCSSKDCAKWFKLRIHAGSYNDNSLFLHGIVLAK